MFVAYETLGQKADQNSTEFGRSSKEPPSSPHLSTRCRKVSASPGRGTAQHADACNICSTKLCSELHWASWWLLHLERPAKGPRCISFCHPTKYTVLYPQSKSRNGSKSPIGESCKWPQKRARTEVVCTGRTANVVPLNQPLFAWIRLAMPISVAYLSSLRRMRLATCQPEKGSNGQHAFRIL